jgi:beta-glucosidase
MLEAAGNVDMVLFVARDPRQGEGGNRADLELPAGQAKLIDQLAEANPNTAVVVLCGAPVSLEPWADRVPAILIAWYAGQATGHAVADVLTGKVCPGGKLSCTFARQLDDYACHALNVWPARLRLEKKPARPGLWPEDRRVLHAYDSDYKEGVFTGYRWFDQHQIEPRFPFGHGLSYTTFEIKEPQVTIVAERAAAPSVEVSVQVTNSGKRRGSEVVQLYVGDRQAAVPRPPRELKGFRKVTLDPGARARVKIALGRRAFAFWSEPERRWLAEPGQFVIAVGRSSRDILFEHTLELK